MFLIVLGIGLAVWAVVEAADTEIATPDRLIMSGPYALSRNPMYVAWTLLYIGITLVANSVWIAVLLPVVVVFTPCVDVRKEEQYLEKQFGDEYFQYKSRVRRYL